MCYTCCVIAWCTEKPWKFLMPCRYFSPDRISSQKICIVNSPVSLLHVCTPSFSSIMLRILPVYFNQYWPVLSTLIIYNTSFFSKMISFLSNRQWSISLFFIKNYLFILSFSSTTLRLHCPFIEMISLFCLFHRQWSLYLVIFIDIN